jgi:hypothetical protein
LTTVLAPKSVNVGKGNQGIVWPVAIVGLLVIAAVIVFMFVADKNDPGDTRAYVPMETVFARRIEQIVLDPKTDAQTKEWAKRIRADTDAGKLDMREGLDALKNVATSETRAQRIQRQRDELCASFTLMIEDPSMPEELKGLFMDARRNIFDSSDDDFEKANTEMESLMNRFDY